MDWLAAHLQRALQRCKRLPGRHARRLLWRPLLHQQCSPGPARSGCGLVLKPAAYRSVTHAPTLTSARSGLSRAP